MEGGGVELDAVCRAGVGGVVHKDDPEVLRRTGGDPVEAGIVHGDAAREEGAGIAFAENFAAELAEDAVVKPHVSILS